MSIDQQELNLTDIQEIKSLSQQLAFISSQRSEMELEERRLKQVIREKGFDLHVIERIAQVENMSNEQREQLLIQLLSDKAVSQLRAVATPIVQQPKPNTPTKQGAVTEAQLAILHRVRQGHGLYRSKIGQQPRFKFLNPPHEILETSAQCCLDKGLIAKDLEKNPRSMIGYYMLTEKGHLALDKITNKEEAA